MEVLSRILKKTEEGGFIQGFHVGPVNSTGIRISHLLFADDTIFFYDVSREQILSIRLVLTCFQAFTGLMVKVGKSEIVPIGEVRNIQPLANILQYRVGSLPMIYLVECFKYLLVAWEKVCLPRELGALGIRKLVPYTGPIREMALESINEGWEIFAKHVSFVVGDSSPNKEACISEVLSPPVGDNDRVWSLSFHRDFNDWELATSYSFLNFIQTRLPRDGGNAESVDHLLLFCPIAHALWMYMLQLFGIEWVMPGSVVGLLFCWYHWLGKHSSDIWDLVPELNFSLPSKKLSQTSEPRPQPLILRQSMNHLSKATTQITHKIQKCPGSPKQRIDKSNAKPPLPNNSTSQYRKGAYHESLDFVHSLCETSYGLVDVFPIEDRKSALRESLTDMNMHVAEAHNSGGVCFPMGKGMYRVLHIPEDEAVLLNSREKAPYLICVEVLKSEVPSNTKDTSGSQKLSRAGIPLANGDALLPKPPPWAYPLWTAQEAYRNSNDRMSRSTAQAIDQAMTHKSDAKTKFVNVSLTLEKRSPIQLQSIEHSGIHCASLQCTSASASILSSSCQCDESVTHTSRAAHNSDLEWVRVVLTADPGVRMEDIEDQGPPRRKEHRRVPSTVAIEAVKAAAAKGEAPPGLPLKGAGQDSTDAQPRFNGSSPKASDALSGELWEVKKERIRRASVHGNLPGWDLRSVIVKSGDDCRQEHLAVQLISHFYDIFQEAGLPLWLRPYEVLVTSSYTALIETIPDTASLHSIKSRYPDITSLREFFIAKYEENSPSFKLAQRNFVESMAGYSLVCYLLQVKDRHNGNLLLDEEGHIIHIDFGFMLSNSPGGVNFESAPFKLTRELLEVMDSDAEGVPSEFFDYFKVLCIQGFLTCRKHAERIILLVEMLQFHHHSSCLVWTQLRHLRTLVSPALKVVLGQYRT
uniref:PI3K/PI4K catalytic domain-containing protein n=1 Tax=Quercus lobata TaxID=97700 RepID=A0A7N2LWU8_QUELO